MTRTQAAKIAGRLPLPEVFDPGDHTVAEVLAYVEEHPDQTDAIREAEQDGKARTTLLTALEPPAEAEAPTTP